MDEEGFRKHLKRGGRSPSAVERCLRYTTDFQRYLDKHPGGSDLDEADGQDLASFVAWIEREPKTSAKTHLWALRYYYEFAGNDAMRYLASALREERIKRAPILLANFRGVDPDHTNRLAAAGVKNVDQMLRTGRTRDDREGLAERTGVPPEAILELVRLSDLARIPGMKGIRARLYLDAGVDTVEKLAGRDPAELREMLVAFVHRSGFDGVAPLPREAAFSVATAQRLPILVEY